VSSNGVKAASVAVCGLSHAIVDAICAGILLTLWRRGALPWPETVASFALYNLLAFAAQPLLGLVVDGSRNPRVAALAGSALVAGAAGLFNDWPLPALVAAGIGNALFHLGAGSICLTLSPGRATAPGLFVAPGDLGLFLGTCLGQSGHFIAWPFVVALAALGVALTRLTMPSAAQTQPPPAWDRKWMLPVVFLLLGCVSVRSLVGFSVPLPWKTGLEPALAICIAVTLGKALGGALADRWGWGRIAVGGLTLAAPMLAFAANSPWIALPGLFLFNLATAVTLAGTARIFPGRPAFAFGLVCLALILGAWPVIQCAAPSVLFSERWVIFGLIVAAAISLYAAVRAASGGLPNDSAKAV